MSVDLDYLEHCNKARPNWTPQNGVASSFLEFLILLNTPLGYAWMGVLALFIWKTHAFTGVLVVLCSLFLAPYWIGIYQLNDDLYLGALGGCVGSLSVTIAVLVVVSFLSVAVVGARWYRRN